MTLANTWPVVAALALAGWATVVCLWRENSRLLYAMYLQGEATAEILAANRACPGVRVTGTITGDGDCWCLAVDEATYRRVAGEARWRDEKQLQEANVCDLPLSEIGWVLYPNDLVRASTDCDTTPTEPVNIWFGVGKVPKDSVCL